MLGLILEVTIGVFILYLLFFQPRWLLGILESLSPEVVYYHPTKEPVIALTIDDSPSETTSLILDVLRQHQVKATFFVISNQSVGHEPILETLVREGHELGNHTTEDRPSIQLSSEDFERDLQQAHLILSKYAVIKWMRPASGWYTQKMLKIASKQGYRVALGSLFPYDTHIPFSRFAIIQILLNIRQGSIIVLHDGKFRGHRTVSTFKTILPLLKKRGYVFVTLSELFADR